MNDLTREPIKAGPEAAGRPRRLGVVTLQMAGAVLCCIANKWV